MTATILQFRRKLTLKELAEINIQERRVWAMRDEVTKAIVVCMCAPLITSLKKLSLTLDSIDCSREYGGEMARC